VSDYRFTVLDVAAEPYAVAPQLTARLRIEETTGQRIHAIALRCQVRIEPQARRYDGGEQDRCWDCSASRLGGRHTQAVPLDAVQHHRAGLSRPHRADLALPCTYDLDVIGARYLHALDAGDVPLTLLFSGTVFIRGETGFGVEQIPWSCEARHRLPVAVWRQMIESYYPNTGGSGWDRTCWPRSPTTGPGTASPAGTRPSAGS
jgi:hypothetical protein